MCQNVIGMGAHGTIERFVNYLGIPHPRMSPRQLALPRVHLIKVLSGCIGVFTGCILGMVPLLFLNSKKRDADDVPVDEAEPRPAAA
jgi:hypothetical protein